MHDVVGLQRLLGGSGSQVPQFAGIKGEPWGKGEAAMKGRKARRERNCIVV